MEGESFGSGYRDCLFGVRYWTKMEEVQHLDMLCRLVTSGMTVTLLVGRWGTGLERKDKGESLFVALKLQKHP